MEEALKQKRRRPSLKGEQDWSVECPENVAKLTECFLFISENIYHDLAQV